jgi:hypothetical protein
MWFAVAQLQPSVPARLVYKTRKNWLRLSESLDDGLKLLASCEKKVLSLNARYHDLCSGLVEADAWVELAQQRLAHMELLGQKFLSTGVAA